MRDLLLHPTTLHQYRALIQSKPHAILVAGPPGSGKKTLAHNYLARAFENKPYLLEIMPEDGTISIEAVRSIRDFLARKTTGTETIRRLVVVYDAHELSIEAQNALLKTLEEPPEDTMFILTVSDTLKLKPTIRSRTQLLQVSPVNLESALSHYGGTQSDAKAIETAFYISQGRVGLLNALLEESEEHELAQAIAAAKAIIKSSPYERLLKVNELSKDKEQSALLLEGLERLVTSGLKLAASKNNETEVKKFYKLSQRVQGAQTALTKNANLKLTLTDLFLNL